MAGSGRYVLDSTHTDAATTAAAAAVVRGYAVYVYSATAVVTTQPCSHLGDTITITYCNLYTMTPSLRCSYGTASDVRW